ncbi:MAG: GAF domain-containing protein [Chloroflexota bacterium]
MKKSPFQSRLDALKAVFQGSKSESDQPEAEPSKAHPVGYAQAKGPDAEKEAAAHDHDHARLDALYLVSQTLGTTLDLDEALKQVMDAVIELTGAERGYLVLLDVDAKNWKVRTARNFSQGDQQERGEMEASRSIVNEVIATSQSILTNDALADPRFSERQSVVYYALRSIMCAPLLCRGRTIGAIYVDNRFQKSIFSEKDLDMLNAFAIQAAIAIDNARLYTLTDQALVRVVRNSPVAIVTLDMEGKVTSWNPAAQTLFGYSSEEMMGQDLDERIAPGEFQTEAVDVLRRALGGERMRLNTQRVCKDGTVLDVELLAVPEEVEGEQIGVLIIYHDITEVQNYLRTVALITDAAAAVEARTFDPGDLAEVALRSDRLGQLARVFQNMAREVYAREERLKQQLHELTIELDQAKKERQVAEITETEYFRNLQAKAEEMRKKTAKE